ncbi:MAG: hypothetical protein ABSH48_24340 [Verrucomicrobiota bacterium]|jgi:predicted butyrate kinase (DUF1464 family)
MNINRWPALLALCAASVVSVHAAELKVGDAVPTFSAKDQFGKDFKFEAGLHFLLLGFDMGASKPANLKLAGLGAGWLEKQKAAYVLDIHTMPGVARLFALPKMRKYPHRIILGDDEKLLAPFPRQAGRITVLVLTSEGKIQEVRYWNPSAEEPSAVLK